MTTADDLRTRQEQTIVETRRLERDAARRVLAGVAVRYRLTVGQSRQLLDMLGLVGEVDEGTPVLQPYAFNQPGEHAHLSAPVVRGHR